MLSITCDVISVVMKSFHGLWFGRKYGLLFVGKRKKIHGKVEVACVKK